MLAVPFSISLNITQDPSQKEDLDRRFMKDPHADLFFVHGEKIFPLHRMLCLESRLIKNDLSQTNKFCLLDESACMNVKILEDVLRLFYGGTLNIDKVLTLEQTLKIIHYLQIDKLKEDIQQQIIPVFQQYDTFFLLNLAYSHNLRRLYSKCFEELVSQEFEQMLYNKFDFMNCDFKLFQIVLRSHKMLKLRGKIHGVGEEEVEEILKLYCVTNHYNAETYHQLLSRYGKEGKLIMGSAVPKRNSPAKNPANHDRLSVQTVPLADLARKDGIKSNIYQAKEEDEEDDEQQPKNIPQFQRNLQFDEQPVRNGNLVQYPFKAITNPPLKGEIEAIPTLPKKAHITRRLSEKISSLNVELSAPSELESPIMKKFNHSVHNKEELHKLDEKSNESKEQGDSIENNFQMEQEADILQGKISVLLDRYQDAYREHDKKFEKMKQQNYGIKSVVLDEEEEEDEYQNPNLFGTGDFQIKKRLENRKLVPNLVQSIFETTKYDGEEVVSFSNKQ